MSSGISCAWSDLRTAVKNRVGITRYEAWRLPPAKPGEIGFVSIVLVADTEFAGDFFRQIDDQLERWAETLEP